MIIEVLAMKNPLNKVTGLFQSSVFSRVKVFYQILIVILVMLFFIGLEGIGSLRTVDTMHQNTQQLFNQSVKEINDVHTVLVNMEIAQRNYLEQLKYGGANYAGSQVDQLLTDARNLTVLDEIAKQNVLRELEQAQQLTQAAPSDANYQALSRSFLIMKLELEKVYNAALTNGINTIQGSKEYSRRTRMSLIVTLILSSLIAVLLGLLIASSISRPLRGMMNAAESLSHGDLTKQIKMTGCLEVNQVVRELNSAITGLRELTLKVNNQAEELAVASKELKGSSFETGRSAGEVARAMEELAKGSTEQADQIGKAVNTVNLLAEMVRKVSMDTESIANASQHVADSAQMGKKATGDVIHQMNELYDSTKEAAGVIDELSRVSGAIGEITSMIENIAGQTSLLALNASIEAARAGEYGKGFGVVARKTAKLAEESKQAAKDISDLITQMHVHTDHAVEAMQKGISRAQQGKEYVDKAGETFETIFDALMDNLNHINEVADSARRMAESNEAVVGTISAIAAISEESMASTEEVSATAQQQTASVEEVTSLADHLSRIADNLKQSVSAFKLDSSDQQLPTESNDENGSITGRIEGEMLSDRRPLFLDENPEPARNDGIDEFHD